MTVSLINFTHPPVCNHRALIIHLTVQCTFTLAAPLSAVLRVGGCWTHDVVKAKVVIKMTLLPMDHMAEPPRT